MIDELEHTRHTTAEIETMKRYCSSTLDFIRRLYADDTAERQTLHGNRSPRRLAAERNAIARWESEGGASPHSTPSPQVATPPDPHAQ